MLRTLVLALIVGAPNMALAEERTGVNFPEAAMGAEVRGHDGRVLGRVTAVERNGDGDIVAVEIPGLAPATASDVAIAERRDDRGVTLVNARADERAGGGGRPRAR